MLGYEPFILHGCVRYVKWNCRRNIPLQIAAIAAGSDLTPLGPRRDSPPATKCRGRGAT
jgi:hypothetical protein